MARGSESTTDDGDGRPVSLAAHLTEQFAAWERRGRGWQVWPYPVELEPPFLSFPGYSLPTTATRSDDGRHETPLSWLVGAIQRAATRGATRPSDPSGAGADDEEPLAALDEFEDECVELQLSVPPSLKISREAMEHLILSLPVGAGPVSFEVLGTSERVTLQLAVRPPDAAAVRAFLHAQFPEVVIRESGQVLLDAWRAADPESVALVDFGLSEECMLPLRTLKTFDVDPLAAVVGALSELLAGEVGLLQVLFQPTMCPWAESMVRAVTDGEGKPFFADAPGLTALAREKVARPMFACTLRLASGSTDGENAWRIARNVGGALRIFENPAGNLLLPLNNDDYDDEDHFAGILSRRTHRSGMLLNLDEIVSLVHLPGPSVRSPKLRREERKTKAAPAIVSGNGLLLGQNAHAGKSQSVTLSPDQRTRHAYVIGASGTGKSTLLLNMIVQDLEAGAGVGVLDPHGDLVDRILERIPRDRLNDVVLLDPADADFPVGFNILSAHSEIEKTLLSSDLVAVFRRLSTSWGDQMNSVLANGILAFLESDRGGTLLDLRRFLVEADYRKEFLTTVRDREVVYYWQREFPLLKGVPQGPLLTRLDTFLRPKLIRHMVAQKENRLDFGAIMNEGRIFLAKLSMGAIGEENAFLLGTLLVAKLQQLALARQEIAAEARRDFYLYIDEFHNFITPSMATILSGARKYRLGLVLAHQDLRQLASRDQDVLAAVISNPYTRVCFRVGDFDAKKLEDGFSTFEAKDLQNLGTGQAICRVERSEYDFNLDTAPLPAVDPQDADARRAEVVEVSRATYALPRAEVEASIERSAPISPPPAPRQAPGGVPTAEASPPPDITSRIPQLTTRPEGERAEAVEFPTAPALPSPGRGGQQHKYLQDLIRRWAEGHGWRAVVEERVLDGLGCVDVALRKGKKSVACEISVTTEAEHELANIQKCRAAGFDRVVFVSPDKRTLAKVKKITIAALAKDERAHIFFESPEGLFMLLDSIDRSTSQPEESVRGYKVSVAYRPLESTEKVAKRQAISKVLAGAAKRLQAGK